MENLKILLIIFTIFAYVAKTLEICGTPFTDPFTSSLRAETVVEAELINLTKVTLVKPLYYAQFDIALVLKSSPDFDAIQPLKIGRFTEEKSPHDECVFENLQPHLRYMFFLNSTSKDYWEITAFPIQSNDQLTEQIKDFLSDSDATLKAPVVTATESVKNGEFKSNITVECTSNAFPPPLFRWWYNKKEVHSKKLRRITSDKHSTRLTLINATHNFHGVYTCEAYNFMSSSNASIQINVQLYNQTIQSDHTVRCPPHLDNNYCFHNATCLILVFNGNRNCKCREGNVGIRCEKYFDYEETKSKSFMSIFENKDFKLPLIIITPIIVLMLLVTLLIGLSTTIKNSCNKKKYSKTDTEEAISS